VKHVYSRALTVSGETQFSLAAHLVLIPKRLTAARIRVRQVSLPVGESAAMALSDAPTKPRHWLPQKLTITFVVNLRRTADASVDARMHRIANCVDARGRNDDSRTRRRFSG
jgi:hypothetical protein